MQPILLSLGVTYESPAPFHKSFDDTDRCSYPPSGRRFTTTLGLSTWFENSAKAATLADAYFGAGQTFANFAAIHIAYGIGGGLVLNRQLYRGVFGRAAEFGALFPYEDVRPSGRDLLIFLSKRRRGVPAEFRPATR